ncbi:Substrate-specific component RibU of riboflavin ECF transporter [Lachnospiraceae bacterium TWA4]|nr:Substrate-specific component RibU of riboflavin ECF transporter [Lachnospiraceae bacterium TWA4]
MNKMKMNTKTLVFTAMMGAVSTVLMAVNFSLPFAPGFLKFDIAEIPALFAGFFLGPVSGCMVVFIKVLLKLITQGTETALVGELMNIMGSVCFILPASLIYRLNHTKKGAIIGMISSSVIVSIAFVFINAYIAFPMYSKLYGMPMETIIAMGTAINPGITDITTLMLYSVFPFNLLKHGVTSLITYFIYKRAGATLRGMLDVEKPLSSVKVGMR